jgi:DNA excision repair protein ERCC-3
MVAYNGQRSAAAEAVMKVLTQQEWGLILLDEVHVAPAAMFRKCVNLTHSRCKLGLTATLVREDDLINDLYYLLGGPKLYEANWLDLIQAGHLATVQCVEVWCDMTKEFYRKYLESTALRKRLLYCMNPNKFRTCESLIKTHEARGDKVLVFSDNVFAIKKYALALGKPFIFGGTSDWERIQCLHNFQHDPNTNCLFISKIGDNSIDLPDVNVIIQISSHFASRRQEAQRLGRILRPKSKGLGRTQAYFYTLVSRDTREMMYAAKRQRFLVAQGYAFKVLTNLLKDLPLDEAKALHYSSHESQVELLAEVCAADEIEGDEEDVDEDNILPTTNAKDSNSSSSSSSSPPTSSTGATRKRGSTAQLSGGADMGYAEFDRAESTKKKKVFKESDPRRNSLFNQREKDKKERQRADRKAKAAES